MADTTNKLAKKNNGTVGENTLKGLINDPRTKDKFREMLGNKSAGFLTSLMNTTNGNAQLKTADPNSILKAGAIAATLDLPIDPNLGFAYIVPYNNKGKNEAQFQMGWKGFYQLAMRTAQYKTINVSELYEGQFTSYDPITDTLEYDLDNKLSDNITHYIAYFKTINGFEKYYVMSKEEVENHARKFSKTFSYNGSSWKTNFSAMARKTVLKLLLSKFGILSIEMQTAQIADQAVIKNIDKDNIEVEYVDNENNINDIIEDIKNSEETEEDDNELLETFNSEELF